MKWYFLLIGIVLFSCNRYPNRVKRSLELAGPNRVELEKVLDFYEGEGLKYHAAEFLIQFMPYYSYQDVLPEFETAFDSMNLVPAGNDALRKDIYINLLSNVADKNSLAPGPLKYDLHEISASFLIENIELAFDAWYNIPENHRASFEFFCDYILPYRNWDEPLEEGSRAYLREKYSWIPDLLKGGSPFRTVIDSVLQGFRYRYVGEVRDYYPSALSVMQFDRSRQGLCQDAVTYFTHVFRSVGIVCSNEYLPQWGTHETNGHSWIYLRYGDTEIAVDAGGVGEDVRLKYIGESIPKVYRRTFAQRNPSSLFREGRDVTAFYRPVIDFELNVDSAWPDTTSVFTVNVYHSNKGWAPVAEMEWEHVEFGYPSTLICRNLGVNTLYIAGRYAEGDVTPLSRPFFVSEKGDIQVFHPDTIMLDSVPLLRKYGLSSPRSHRKAIWIKNLEGSAIVAARDSTFSNADTLFRLTNFWSTHQQTYELHPAQPYRCVKFVPRGDTVHLAELAFFGARGNLLEGEIVSHNVEPGLVDSSVFDGNPLTYSGGISFDIGYRFSRPVRIHSIAIQARNDDNHIRAGDEYELQFWDGSWKSLGRQIAHDTILYYDQVPRNALMILRNHTRGKEEIPFRINERKEQEWFGFYNY